MSFLLAVLFVNFLLLTVTRSQEHVLHESARHRQILGNLAKSFMEADNDFIISENNSLYFPLSESRKYNRLNGRHDYNVIMAPDFGDKVSSELNTWRGFSPVEEQNVEDDWELMIGEASNFETAFGNRWMTRSELEHLPLGWQYLLPHVFYDGLELPGSTWAALINAQPMNTALLYKVALLLRNKDDSVKDVFIHHLELPSMCRDDLGYILGYRWGIDVSDDADRQVDDFNLKTLLHLPADVVLGLDEDLYRKLNMREMLKDVEEWSEASQCGKVAWFTKFLKEDGWEAVAGSAQGLMALGHLMAGAPLHLLEKINKNALDASLLADVLNKTDMNPLRVQELWEGLDKKQQQWMFFGQAHKLDASQLIEYYSQHFAHLHNEKHFLDGEWLSGSGIDVPWANLMVVGMKHMDQGAPSTWRLKNLLELGKFLVLLFPPQLEAIPASEFNLPNIFDGLLSPRLTHCQRTAIYRKYLEIPGQQSMPSILMAAIPSDIILQLGSYNPPIPVNFALDQASLFEASKLFSPGQMHALHSVVMPVVWQDETLKSILLQHAECLGFLTPREFRENIESVVGAIQLAGPSNFHRIAANVQELPRPLLMAWLEAVFHMPGSSKKGGTWWHSDVLLDRNIPGDEDPRAPNPSPGHPLRAQFNKVLGSSRSFLPSLALAGISCHCIEKIETHDSLEVLGLYRYHIKSRGQMTHIPSMARKCWAMKIRQFLRLKAHMFNVTVSDELELLSLLSTSDIKAVGGEVLLTWGGAALVGITHPQVQHEVLMTVAANPPHYLLRNGVDLTDVEYMTKALLHNLAKPSGLVTFTVLSRLNNLLPFVTDDKILEVTAEDARLYISTVLKPESKAICIPSKSRQRFRALLLKAYGEPEGWSPLDLVTMGDLMVVLSRAELLRVPPTSLRRAAAQLVENTLYTRSLEDVRGFTDKAIYHEACSYWLGSKQGLRSFESTEFTKAWRSLAEFYVLGSHLQVEVVEVNLKEDPDRANIHGRTKRQAADANDEITVKNLYLAVMNDMKGKFEKGTLTEEQKAAATRVITETQTLLGEHSFRVLGLERGERNSQEVFQVLKEYKDSGNMTAEQDLYMQKLAEDTQVRMIQGILEVFNYTGPQAAAEYSVPEGQIIELLGRPTFTIDQELIDSTTVLPVEPSDSTSATSILSVSSTLSTTVSTTTEDELKLDIETLTTFVTGQPSISSTTSFAPLFPDSTPAPVDYDVSVFLRYQPQTSPLKEQFATLPSLASPNVKLSCYCIKASGEAASALTAEHIRAMEDEEVVNCLDTLGKLAWPRVSLRTVWAAVQSKAGRLPGLQEGKMDRETMMLLENLLPAVAEYSSDLLDLGRQNIDGISIIGSRPVTGQTARKLAARFWEENLLSIGNPLASSEVASLGQLLCGFSESQWLTTFTPKIFKETLTEALARLECSVTEPVRDHLGNLLLDLYGPTEQWTSSDLLSVGWAASTLPAESISSLPAHVMEGFSPFALRQLDNQGFGVLTEEQLFWLNPHTASFIKREQILPHIPAGKRRAIRAAGGESPQLRDMMEEVETFMAADDPPPPTEAPEGDDAKDSTAEPEPEAEASPKSGAAKRMWSLYLLAVIVVFLNNAR